MLRGLWLGVVLGVEALACGGGTPDETTLLGELPAQRMALPVGTPQTSIGTEQPARPGTRPSPSQSNPAAPAVDLPSTPPSGESPQSPSGSPDSGVTPLIAQDCEPGAGRCNGPRAEQCSPEGTWLLVEVCGQCNGFSTCAVFGGARCLPTICCSPQTRCNGEMLERCNATATGFEPLQDCGTPELCDSIRGACLSVCIPGRMRCDGAELQRCSADGSSFMTVARCVTSALCFASAGEASCGTGCAVGELRCVG